MTTTKVAMPVDGMGIIVVERKKKVYLTEEIGIIGKPIAGNATIMLSSERDDTVMASMKASTRIIRQIEAEERIDRRKRNRELNKRTRRTADVGNRCEYKKTGHKFESMT